MRNEKGQFVKGYESLRKGTKHSKESLQKMSLIHKGQTAWNKGKKCPYVSERNKSIEMKLAVSKFNKGKSLSLETRRKISLSQIGHKQSLETRLKKSQNAPKGEKHHNWKGGITPLHFKIRSHPKYLWWRNEIFKRDNYICINCGYNKGNILNADHIKPFALILKENNIKSLVDAINCDILWDIKNGRTLCEKCHILRHSSNRMPSLIGV